MLDHDLAFFLLNARPRFARWIRRNAGRAMRFADRLEFPAMTGTEIRRHRQMVKLERQALKERIMIPADYAREFPAYVPAQPIDDYAREMPAYVPGNTVRSFVPYIPAIQASCRNCGCMACSHGRCGPVCTYGDW